MDRSERRWKPLFFPKHCMELSQNLFQQVEDSSPLCDLQLTCKGEQVLRVHSCVVNSIPYFVHRSSFYSGAETERNVVDLTNLSIVGIKIVMKYVYTGEIEISVETLEEVFDTALHLLYDELIDIIMNWLLSMPPTLNNISTLRLVCDTQDLTHEGLEDLRLHFDGKLPELLDGEYLLMIDPETLRQFITVESYSYVPRIKFAKFLLHWTKHDPMERKPHFPSVFEAIVLDDIEQNDLQEIFNDSLVKEFPDIAEKVERAMNLAMRREKPRDVEAIVVVGGKASNGKSPIRMPDEKCYATKNVWAYLIDKNKWIALPQMPVKVERPAAVCDGRGNLYVVELANGMTHTFHQFSFSKAKWSSETLTFPDEFIPTSVKQLVAIDNYLFLVVFGMSKADKALKRPLRMYIFEVVEGRLTHPILMESVVPEAKIRVCSLGRKFLLHVNQKKTSSAFLVKPKSQDVVKLPKKMAKDLEKGLLCSYYGNIVQYNPGRKVNYYTVKPQSMKLQESTNMSSVPADANPYTMAFAACYGDLVVCGGQHGHSACCYSTAYTYDYAKKIWKELANLPEALMESAAVHVMLPAKLTNCVEPCPHCRARTLPDYKISLAARIPSEVTLCAVEGADLQREWDARTARAVSPSSPIAYQSENVMPVYQEGQYEDIYEEWDDGEPQHHLGANANQWAHDEEVDQGQYYHEYDADDNKADWDGDEYD